LYKSLLIWKYLRKRRIAWVSLVAVMLCTAMVLVVISVMSGWLRMFRASFHGITGDVIVSRKSVAGFPHYEEMIQQILKLPGVTGAAPTLHTFGLVNIYGQLVDGVQVFGYPIERMNGVTRFRESLIRQFTEPMEIADDPKKPAELREAMRKAATQPASFEKPFSPETYRALIPNKNIDPNKWGGIIVGAGVIGIGKDENGQLKNRDQMEELWLNLTVLGLSDKPGGMTNIQSQVTPRNYWVVDASRTKIWQYDQNSVYVPFEQLQNDLSMQERRETDPKDPNRQYVDPARTNDIQIGMAPGADLEATAAQIQKIVDQTLKDKGVAYDRDPVTSLAWYQTQPTAKFLGAVEKEIVLVTFLFAIISIVAIFLVFCIFFMIVVEKTRDIGIIKSVGATSSGVAGIFLGYGFAIGVVGGLLGLLAAYGIVHNINELHEWMGRVMGVKMWDPETYAFDTIPNTMSATQAAVIVGIAVLSSLLGALVPAIRAARMHPVEALRWE
jgi:lipoprotein-releasing system permease protein